MKVLVRHRLRRTRREGFVERTEVLEGEEIRIGRGSDTELHLPDSRVLLHHATLSFDKGALFLRADANAEIELDGIPVDVAQLSEGHTVAIGPYDITCGTDAGECDAAIGVELARPLGDAETLVRQHVRTPLLSRRRSGWTVGALVALVLLAAGLAIPLGSFLGDREPQRVATTAQDTAILRRAEALWVTERLSDVHHNLDSGCQACHVKPFAEVAEATCLDCHDTLTAHIGPHATFSADVSLDSGCASCHREHDGADGMLPGVAITETGCISCHSQDVSPDGSVMLASVPSIAGHPPISLPEPPESGLIFSHASHLVPEGKRGATGERVTLGCTDCHAPASEGRDMTLPSFEENCQSCHTLAFAAEDPGRRLPHGSAARVRTAVVEFYEALDAGEIDVPVIEAPSRRRRPGAESRSVLVEPPATVPPALRAARAIEGPAVKGQCATCHVLEDGPDAARWEVAPVRFVDDWMELAKYDHADHVAETACTTCHAVSASEQASDVAMPGMETCLSCHGTELDFPDVESTCVTCHDFHGSTGAQAMVPRDGHHGIAALSPVLRGRDEVGPELADSLGAYLASAGN